MAIKVFKKKNVFDAALERINYLFDEFEEVVVGMSGGKDSTIVFQLALIVARERGRLPLKVMFLDQEAEWNLTIDVIKKIMYMPEIEPLWFQIPFKLFNATSSTDNWLMCWQEGDEWMRDKDPISKKENIYKEDRFNEMFTAIMREEFKGKRAAYLSGVRAEESPSRKMGLTMGRTYKWITWGKILDKKQEQFTFYPIYDWYYTDVWKAIHVNNWEYNKLYDYQYRYGVKIQSMRVSNLHHETAVEALFYLQEIEPDTYRKLTKRLKGIDCAGKMGYDDFFVRTLPFMFSDWKEYCIHLINTIVKEEWRVKFMEKLVSLEPWGEKQPKIFKVMATSIMTNDHEFIKLTNFMNGPSQIDVKRELKRERDKLKEEK